MDILFLVMANKLQIITHNANGLGNEMKQCKLFHYLHAKNSDICLLQECHSQVNVKSRWSAEWTSKIWFAHTTNQTAGVAILFKKKLPIKIHNVIQDQEDHYLLLYLTYQDMKLLICNIYVPNKDSPEFIGIVIQNIDKFSPDYLIVTGDFNFAIDVKEDRQGTHVNNDKAAAEWSQYLQSKNLLNMWHHMHPEKMVLHGEEVPVTQPLVD